MKSKVMHCPVCKDLRAFEMVSGICRFLESTALVVLQCNECHHELQTRVPKEEFLGKEDA